MVRVAWLFAAFGLLAGCSAGADPGSTTSAAGGGEGGSDDGGSDSSSAKSSGSGDGGDDAAVSVGSTSTGSGGSTQIAEAYGHSASTLYRLDLDTNQVGIVAAFSGCDDQVIDIALDKDSVIYGTTLNRPSPDMPGVPTGGLWKIDKVTAVCQLISRGDFPNSLSFVPRGTLDSAQEALVGYVGANYVRINTQTGAITTVKGNALPPGLQSSGDIVSVIDGPTYLTVKGDGCEDTDCVVEVDPSTGEAIGNLGSANYDSVFGVAFWAGKLYGFTSAGDIFEFFREEDGSISTNPIPASVDQFYGAGSTTAAPPTDVPN